MAKMKWGCLKNTRATEDKLGEGVVKWNGAVTRTLPKDSLAQRAARAEREFLKQPHIRKIVSKRPLPA